MGSEVRGGWPTKKTPAVIVSLCVVTVAVAITLVLVLGGGDGDQAKNGNGTSGEEELLETYEEIKQEAEEAVSEMEDLESDEAASNPDVYAQELEEAEAAW